MVKNKQLNTHMLPQG